MMEVAQRRDVLDVVRDNREIRDALNAILREVDALQLTRAAQVRGALRTAGAVGEVAVFGREVGSN